MSTHMDKRKKLIRYARTKYASRPVEFTEAELDAIEKNGYECSMCRKSVFDLYDYPVVRDGMVLCEDCYCDEYMETCPVCEEHYEEEKGKDYFFITKDTVRMTGKPVGLYRALKRPFFRGDCVTGFDAFFDDAIEQVNDLDIEDYLTKKRGHEVLIHTELICPDCAEKYRKLGNLIKED